jgi:DNA-binding NarL/FixJ family response regulator
MDKIDVCICDDHQIFRKALMGLLKTFERVGNISDASNGKECIQTVREKSPNVVLMDLEMPVMNGVECAEYILRKFKDVKIIMLTMHDSEKVIAYALEIGIHSFLFKNSDPEELEEAIYSVHDNDFYHNDLLISVIRKSLHDKLKTERPYFRTNASLTEREIEILKMICEEKSLKSIADKLGLSEKTVQTHKLNIQSKLKVAGTVGLVKAAYEMKLI